MHPTLLNPTEQIGNDIGPRLKKFTRDECDAIAESGLIDVQPLELIEGDILVKHTDDGPVRRRWTRDEVEALGDSGALNVERLELIDGELYDKMGKNLPHWHASHRITRILVQIFGFDRVTVEGTINVPGKDRVHSQPQPDVLVLNRNIEGFSALPQSSDVTLLLEISDTTLRFDLGTKARLYARSGILEYWVVNVKRRKLIVHRDPSGGRYTSVVSYEPHESIAPLAAPDHAVAVASLFPESVA